MHGKGDGGGDEGEEETFLEEEESFLEGDGASFLEGEEGEEEGEESFLEIDGEGGDGVSEEDEGEGEGEDFLDEDEGGDFLDASSAAASPAGNWMSRGQGQWEQEHEPGQGQRVLGQGEGQGQGERQEQRGQRQGQGQGQGEGQEQRGQRQGQTGAHESSKGFVSSSGATQQALFNSSSSSSSRGVEAAALPVRALQLKPGGSGPTRVSGGEAWAGQGGTSWPASASATASTAGPTTAKHFGRLSPGAPFTRPPGPSAPGLLPALPSLPSYLRGLTRSTGLDPNSKTQTPDPSQGGAAAAALPPMAVAGPLQLGPQHLAYLAWSLSTLRHVPRDAWLDDYMAACDRQVGAMPLEVAADVVWGLPSLLRLPLTPHASRAARLHGLLEGVVRQVERALLLLPPPPPHPDDPQAELQALPPLPPPPPLPSARSSSSASAAAGAGALPSVPTPLPLILSTEASSGLLGPTLARLLFGLGQLGHRPSNLWLKLATDMCTCPPRLHSMSPADLADLLTATAMHRFHLPAAMLYELLEALAAGPDDGRSGGSSGGTLAAGPDSSSDSSSRGNSRSSSVSGGGSSSSSGSILMARCPAPQLANTAWALGALQRKPSLPWLARYLGHVRCAAVVVAVAAHWTLLAPSATQCP